MRVQIAGRSEAGKASGRLGLRAGEWVEVKSKEEILATLDPHGRLDALPFMPEMFQYCGKRFRVFKRAHKTCDTVNNTGGRLMNDAVHLDDVDGMRCDGSAHEGCQAACLLFWKEAWLRRVSGPDGRTGLGRAPRSKRNGVVRLPIMSSCTEEAVIAATRKKGTEQSGDPTYVCQATALPQATRLMPWWDFRQYVEDCSSGNVSVGETLTDAAYIGYTVIAGLAYRVGFPSASWLQKIDEVVRRVAGTVPFPERRGNLPPGEKPPVRPALDLQPGELVRVRPHEEILATLDQTGKHRGMYFGTEDAPHCGTTFRVRSRVNRLVSEHTGKMIHLKGNNVILEGAWCASRYSRRRRHCPRAIYTFWREDWLERTEPARSAASTNGRQSLPVVP
jgi:hypothetical protein